MTWHCGNISSSRIMTKPGIEILGRDDTSRRRSPLQHTHIYKREGAYHNSGCFVNMKSLCCEFIDIYLRFLSAAKPPMVMRGQWEMSSSSREFWNTWSLARNQSSTSGHPRNDRVRRDSCPTEEGWGIGLVFHNEKHWPGMLKIIESNLLYACLTGRE